MPGSGYCRLRNVMTEQNCLSKKVAEDGVGLASYNMDSHNCRRVVVKGAARNEGIG